MSDKPAAPAGLEAAGRKLWRDVNGRYRLRDDESAALEQACRTLDELGRLRRALAATDVVTVGSKGQPVAHPLLAEIRAHRVTLARLMYAVGLGETGEGDPALARSSAARTLAAKRWASPATWGASS